jgi:Homeodomain-like domain
MRSREEVAAVLELVGAGWNDCEIARELAIPRATVRDWRAGKTPDFDRVRTRLFSNGWVCAVCRGDPLTLPQAPYTYLLGLYLATGISPPTPGACTGCGFAAPTPIPS